MLKPCSSLAVVVASSLLCMTTAPTSPAHAQAMPAQDVPSVPRSMASKRAISWPGLIRPRTKYRIGSFSRILGNSFASRSADNRPGLQWANAPGDNERPDSPIGEDFYEF